MSGLNRNRPADRVGSPRYSDSEMNQLRDLRGEAFGCCTECDACLDAESADALCCSCRDDLEHTPPAHLSWEPWQDLVARHQPAPNPERPNQ